MALTSDQITAQNFADFYQKILPYLNGGGVGLKLLWENSDPTQSFAAQNIELANSDYDLLMWMALRNNSGTLIEPTVTVPKGTGGEFGRSGGASSGALNTYRSFAYIDDTHYSIAGGSLAKGTTAETSDNTVCIPYRVYGIKL